MAVPDVVSFTDSAKITALKAPDPLPPSPADSDPGGWLQGGTDPTKIPDLGAMAGTGHTDPGSLPAWAKVSRTPSSVEEEPSARHRVPRRSVRADSMGNRPARRSIVAPVAIICLALGMLLGAVLQSSLGSQACPDPTAHEQAPTK